jgi:mono/diheme cytochrome c family protein
MCLSKLILFTDATVIPMRLLLSITPLLVASVALADDRKEVPIGATISNLSFKDTRFLTRSLDDFPKRKAFVIVAVDTACPLVKRYLPVLTKLEAEYRGKDVQFLALDVASDETILEMAALALEHGVPFPFVKDRDGKCAATLGLERTPEVVVLDVERKIRYRGRIDDQYRPGGSRPAPTRMELKLALDELIAGKEVSVTTTTVDGCLITRPAPAKESKPITYAEHIGPLLHKHCVACHKPGTAAPFSLVTYDQAFGKAKAIAEVTSTGRMPPWFAAPGHSKFSNERKLTAAERDLIRRWVQGGMAEGDESAIAKLPKVEPRKGEWLIGEPDLILNTATFDLPAEGDIEYKYVVLPNVFLHETWLRSVQILPDNPRVMHHCNMAYFSAGKSFDASNFVTGLVPGADPMELKDGVAYRLPPGSVLGLQIHMVATGKPEKCKIRVGLKFASGDVSKQLRFFLFDGRRFTIPAEAPAHPIGATHVLDRDAVGIGMFAHMHLRGRAMTFTATPPDGKTETLLMIPNYHFDWQIPYVLETGVLKLPKGTKLECVGLYDNSAFNPFNPDHKAIVRSGQQTYNEMMNGFLFYVDANEDLKLTADPKTGRARPKVENR